MARLTIKAVTRKVKREGKQFASATRQAGRSLSSVFAAVRKSIKVYRKTSRDTDRGFEKRMREIDRFRRTQVVVGILAAEGSAGKKSRRNTVGKLTVVQVGAIHEFGAIVTKTGKGGQYAYKIPRRSFIRGYYDEKRMGIEEAIRRMAIAVARGERTATQAHNLLGQRFVAGMQDRMSRGIAPPLEQPTIKRKGSSVPLIDTGQLRSSITYKLRTRAKK